MRSAVQVRLSPQRSEITGVSVCVLNLKKIREMNNNHAGSLAQFGRAPDLHSGGQEFNPPSVHHTDSRKLFEKRI